MRIVILLKLSIWMGVYIRFCLLIIILEEILVSLVFNPDIVVKAISYFGDGYQVKLTSLSSVEELEK